MFSEFLFEKRWIDLGSTRKMAAIVWLFLAGAITVTVTLAIYREVLDRDTTQQAIFFAILFSLIFVGMYHYGIFQWHKAATPGLFITNRNKTKVTAALICFVGFISLFIANTGNLHYFLTFKEATKNDILELNTKVKGMEDSMREFLTSNYLAFDSAANQMAGDIYTEMTGSKNPGISGNTAIKLTTFNKFVGSAVIPQSSRVSATTPNFQLVAAELKTQLDSAIRYRSQQIGAKNQQVNDLLNDAISKDIKLKLDAYMKDLSYVGKTSRQSGGNNNQPDEVAAPFLEQGFNEYNNDKNALKEILKHPALQYSKNKPVLPDLSKTPYSSDLRTLGRMYQGGDDWGRFISVKFFLSILLSALFDIWVGFLFYKLISRRD
jgi:hypothetical protein